MFTIIDLEQLQTWCIYNSFKEKQTQQTFHSDSCIEENQEHGHEHTYTCTGLASQCYSCCLWIQNDVQNTSSHLHYFIFFMLSDQQ